MELYTSHWRNEDLVHRNDLVAVGVSRGVPRGKLAKRLAYRYKRLVGLAPPNGLFERWKAGTIGPDEYTRVYHAYLDSLGPEEVMGQLEKKSAENGEKPLVLLCWCSPGEFCHRRIWADWYLEKTGQEVPELGFAGGSVARPALPAVQKRGDSLSSPYSLTLQRPLSTSNNASGERRGVSLAICPNSTRAQQATRNHTDPWPTQKPWRKSVILVMHGSLARIRTNLEYSTDPREHDRGQ